MEIGDEVQLSDTQRLGQVVAFVEWPELGFLRRAFLVRFPDKPFPEAVHPMHLRVVGKARKSGV